MARPAHIKIDIDALHHNVRQVRQLAPHSSILAMVKANAYGHRVLLIAAALQEIDALGVASIEEALLLRRSGFQQPIFLTEGCFAEADLHAASTENITLIVHQTAQIDYLEKNPSLGPFSVWLKINTGMNRLGFKPEDVKQAHRRLSACPNVKKPIGLMTHFSSANLIHDPHTTEQITLFDQAIKGLEGPRSLANSAGILYWPTAHRDWIRPGLMLYGVSPVQGHTGAMHGLRPVMTLQSEIISIQHVKKNEAVGYERTWICPSDRRIGVVAMGYGDGYPQRAQNGTPVLVNGDICPLVGRVSMDMLTVDLESQPDAEIGDPVILWGDGLSVETVAGHNHMSPYELLCRLTARLPISS